MSLLLYLQALFFFSKALAQSAPPCKTFLGIRATWPAFAAGAKQNTKQQQQQQL